jgi:acyl carrier protein
MITTDAVDTIIFHAIEALNAERDPDDQIEMSPATPLFGIDAALDSLEFVSLIIDVEASLNVDHGLNISLADDRAMARPQSPYATVGTLRNYILEIGEGT